MTTVDKAAQLLRLRISEVDAERAKLEKALEALSNTASGSQQAARRRRTGQRRVSGGRARRGRRREQLLESVRSRPDAKLADHAKAIGITGNHASTLVRQLVDEGRVVKVGRGRYKTAGSIESDPA